jgi:hypothetical protein
MADGKAGDRKELERLLRAAHRFADRCWSGLSKDQLEKLRQELADALKQVDDNPRSGK